MSTAVTYVGTQYNVPAYQDTGYAQGSGNLSSYLIALATGSLTLSGGTFTLTADADFGANFGLKSIYYKSRNATPATTGVIRLGSAELICWRDNGDTADLELTTNASDQLTFNGNVIASSTGALVGTTLTLSATSNQMVIGTTNTTTLSFTAPSASRTYTIPDAGGAAAFVLTAGTQTIGGAKTFSSAVTINPTTNQLVLGVTNTTTISATAPASSAVYTIPDVGTTADFLFTAGAQTITGAKTYANQTLLLQETGGTDVVTINVAALVASRAYTVPDAGAAASFVMTEGAQTVNGVKTFADGTNVTGNQSSDVDFNVINSSSNAAAGSRILVNTQSGGYDPRTSYVVTSGTSWVEGVDNSDSDSYKISVDTTELATNTAVKITTAGEMTKPLQPAFLVTNGTGAADVTGDGTAYTVLWPTEVYDQGGDFATNTFTAPVTGRYFLQANVFARQIGTAHTPIVLAIVTTARTYNATWTTATGTITSYPLHICVVADMSATDTAFVRLTVSGSTKTVDIDNSASDNYFSGCLLA